MAIYHPIVTIEIVKSYCIQKNANKSANEINKKLRELSEDKTNWSLKILNKIKEIIETEKYNLPIDIFEVHHNKSKILKYQFNEDILKNKNHIMNEAHQQLKYNDQDATEVIETIIINNIKYSKLNDIQMAHMILLLSKLSKESNKLWLIINLIIKELGTNLSLYFKTDGHIYISKKNKINVQNNGYIINILNDMIDGKREVPYIV